MSNDVIKILKKKFSRLKKTKLNLDSDLIKNRILDSLEMIELLEYLEKKTKFRFKLYQKKHNNFIIKNLNKFI
jgi:acyl carrier protein